MVAGYLPRFSARARLRSADTPIMPLSAEWVGDRFFFVVDERKCTKRTLEMIGPTGSRKHIVWEGWTHGGATKAQEAFPEHSTMGASASLATGLPNAGLSVQCA